MLRWLLILTYLSTLFAQGQDNSIKFRNLTIEDGLSQSSVYSVVQDQHGFIWIGTQDGLNRFDGHSFKVFKHKPGNPTSLSNSFITTLFEDSKGNLWIGTEGGLNVFKPKEQQLLLYAQGSKQGSLSDNNITSICEGGEGNIWVGTKAGGINIINPESHEIRQINTKNSKLPSDVINAIYLSGDGAMWVGTLNGLVEVSPKGSLSVYRHTPNCLNCLSNNAVWSIASDSLNFIWIGTSQGLNKLYLEEDSRIFTSYNVGDGKDELKITDILVDRDQAIWFGTSGRGLYKLYQDKTGATKFSRFYNIHYSSSSLTDDNIFCLTQDFSGNIWIGTRHGVSRFDVQKQGFVHLKKEYLTTNTLPDNTIWNIQPEGNDKFWIGTKGGLSFYNRVNNTFTNYTYPSSNPNRPNDRSVQCFYKDKKGGYWMGTVDGLFQAYVTSNYQIISRQKIKYKEDLPGEDDPIVYQVLHDSKGRYWVATREGLSKLNPNSSDFTFYRSDPKNPKTLSNSVIRAIHEDTDGNIWLATHSGLNKLQEAEDSVWFEHYFGQDNILKGVIITSVYQNNPDYMWIGTYGNGLAKLNLKDGSFKFYTRKSHGIVNDAIYGVVGDDKGTLWLSTNNGLTAFNPIKEESTNYTSQDGLQSNEFNTGAYCKTKSGELVFGGINGLNFFRPENIHVNPVPPRVIITNFLVDNTFYDKEKAHLNFSVIQDNIINLPYNKRSKVTIEFAALHFTNPDNNTFKYMLEGVDEDFVITGNDYRANYTNLPPGEYTFKVFAANSDGVWSEEPAEITIIIATPYWRTTWFQFMLIAIGLTIAYGFYWMRVRDIRKQKVRLAQIVEEKTSEVLKQKNEIEKQKELLQYEKDKAEQLLLNILPEETAEELKSKGKASARQYRRVSVMFTDFKGFTQISERLKPTELVARLDNYFIQFDKIIERYNLEKIKTIGDSYMCAGGLPVRNRENPIHMTLAALSIQAYMHELKRKAEERQEESWELRIGINTGEVIAGVIGTKRFAYDIWGSTVNVASRLEAACEPGRVNVSGKTFDFVEPYFECEYRGKIPAKNAGNIDMYYVNRIKPELSADEHGLEPNQSFWDYVNLHLFSSINYMKAERYIMKQLKKKLSPALHYHSIEHTIDVTEAAERIALMEGIKGEDLFLLQTAATYHDAGFVEQYENNEPVGARMAAEILPRYGYTEEQIQRITELIHATKIPHEPQNHLEQIICDADLDYLGRDDFHEIADKLRRELREHGKINSDRLWDEIQIKFLSAHTYFTKSAIVTRQAKKEQHIEEIKQRLKEDNYKD